MLLPVLIPLCIAASPAAELTASTALPVSLAAVAVHSTAMLTMTGAIATLVYRSAGLKFLRRGWINLDLIWTVALAGAGMLLILSA